MEAPNENPKYKVELDAVISLTLRSAKSDVDAAIAALVKTLVQPDMTPAYRQQIFNKLNWKANSYEENVSMRRNPRAMYIANGIRSAVTSVRNFINAHISKDRSKYLRKYGL